MADPQPGVSLEVEVVYAQPHAQTIVPLSLPAGSTIAGAIAASGITGRHPEVDWHSVAVGIFGKRAQPSTVLHEHDRIEIYRPLIADPKQARRKRARPPRKPGR